jgi:integrase
VAKRSKRAPGIYELEPGLFKVVVSLGRDGTGRYRQHARTVRGTLRDAKAARSRALTEAADGKVLARAEVTFGALLDRWLEQLETLGRSPTTIAAYRVIARCHLQPRLGGKSVSSITTLDLDSLYATLARQRASATVVKVHGVARGALAQAVRWGLLGRNPAVDASPPPIRRREARGATKEQLGWLLAAADDDFATMLVVAATTGLRRGELCGLTWEALELPPEGAGAASVHQVVVHGADDRPSVRASTKSGRSRRITLDPGTVAALRVHRERAAEAARSCGVAEFGPFVFSPSPDSSEPYRPHSVTRRFSRLCCRVGIDDLTFHQATRHFAATHLIAGGVDIRTVAGRLGHSRASVTLDVYSHLLAERDEVAATLLGSLVHESDRGASRQSQAARRQAAGPP